MKIVHQCDKRVKTKNEKVLQTNYYVCRSYRRKTGLGWGAFCHPFPPSSWIGLILSTEKYFEMSPRHDYLPTISESFALNLIISVPLTNK